MRADERRLLASVVIAVMLLSGAASHAEQKKPDSPREMFRALGVDDRHFERLADGRPLDAGETETVLRVLFRLRTFPLMDIEHWAKDADEFAIGRLAASAPTPDRLAIAGTATQQPGSVRGEIFRLRGRVLDVAPVQPSAADAQRFELARYFRCRLQLDPSSQMVDVYTEHVPDKWRDGDQPDVSGGAFGVFLKSVGQVGNLSREKEIPPPNASLLIFAAPRLAWYPDDLLGQLGMDFGLFDSVQNQKAITPTDREAFYQLLAAVGRAQPGQLLRQADDDMSNTPDSELWTDRQGQRHYSVVPLFNEAATQRGRLVELLGTARRVEKIFVTDADIVARFGIDHYYQVSLFTDDSEGNPLTFCVRELPEGMPYGNLPRYGEAVRVAGFFFKTWSYAVPKMTDPALSPGDPKTHRQLSPLLIGDSLVWYPSLKPADTTMSGALVGGLFLVIMVVVWLVAWQSRRLERKWLERMESPPQFVSGIDLDQVGQHADGSPDFSRVAEMDHETNP